MMITLILKDDAGIYKSYPVEEWWRQIVSNATVLKKMSCMFMYFYQIITLFDSFIPIKM